MKCPNGGLMGAPVDVTPVTEIRNPAQLLTECMPAFGGAFIKRIFQILDRAIGQEIPLIMSVAGPVTVSNQHRAWLNPLLNTGWVSYITVTDAACYHDGHDSLQKFDQRPIRTVPIEGFDEEMREQNIIRVTDTGFDEQILFDQDRFFSAMLQQPEFQKKMTGTEFRNRLGKYYAAQEEAHGVQPGLLSTCWRNGIPVFVGSPGDGSAFLNSMKLWALHKIGAIEKHNFDIDVHAEVFESCAYHYWGITESEAKKLAILILGGGVPKNFSLQPEPALSQIFLLDGIDGYACDVQIVGAPVTQGDLTGCKPGEAVTWGKVDPDVLDIATESIQTDYTMVMPLIAWALLDKRRRMINMLNELGEEELYSRHPEANGYIRAEGQLRLFDRRDELTNNLLKEISRPKQLSRIKESLDFPLALLDRAIQ